MEDMNHRLKCHFSLLCLQSLGVQARPGGCLDPWYGDRAGRAAYCGTATAGGEPTAADDKTPLTQTH